MIINKSGVAIRMSMTELRVMGRNTQGVKVINLKGNDSIAAIAKVEKDDDVEDETEETTDELPASVNSDLPEFSETPKTGDNAFTNLGDEKTLKKIEEDEEKENRESQDDVDSAD
jgi:DNA gyrase subunit A